MLGHATAARANAENRHRRGTVPRPGPWDAQLLALQATAGNRAVTGVLSETSAATVQRCGGEVHDGCPCAGGTTGARLAVTVPPHSLAHRARVAQRKATSTSAAVNRAGAQALAGRRPDPQVQRSDGAEGLTSPFWSGEGRLEAAVRNAPPLTAADNGEPVAILQEALAEQQIPLRRSVGSDGRFDGKWGEETTAAVRQFQREAGVRPVGGWEAGRKTLTALDRRLPGQRRGGDVDPPPAPFEGAAIAAAHEDIEPVIGGGVAAPPSLGAPVQRRLGQPSDVIGDPKRPAPKARSIKVRWADGLHTSLRNLIRFKVTDPAQADRIIVGLLADPSAYYTASDGQRVARANFEATAAKDGAFVLTEGMVALLMAKSGLSQPAIEEGGKDDEKYGALMDKVSRWQFFGTDEGKSSSPAQEARERGRDRDKAEKVEGDVGVLAVGQVAALYLRLLQEYAGAAVADELRKKAEVSGLTPDEVKRLVGGSPARVAITGLFTQAVVDGKGAFNAEPADLARAPEFVATVTTVVEQFSFGNPTVARNQVRLRASGVPEMAPGLVFVDGTLYYDIGGNPLRSFAGEGFRDPGFQGAPRQNAWYNLINIDAIADPELREFFRLLKQQVGDSTALIARGAEALYDNFGPVRDLVVQGLDDETKKELLQAVETLAFFLVAKGAILAAERSNVPALQAMGAAADGLLAIGQLLLDIDMVGTTVSLLVQAGYHLCRVHKDENGMYTATAKYEMAAAADIIRHMLAMVVSQAILKEGLGKTEAGYKKVREKLGRAAGGEASRLRCNTCILEVAPSRRAEKDFKEMYGELVKKKKVKEGQVYRSPDYPGVVIHPDGRAFGPYDQLLLAAQHGKLTGKQPKEGQGYVVQIHHIFEDTIAAKFGISRGKGRCVAIESDDHMRFSRYMTERSSNRKMNDVWDAHAAHREMYQDLGNKELLPELDHSISEHKATILKAYEDGRVPGRPRKGERGYTERLETARKFLNRF